MKSLALTAAVAAAFVVMPRVSSAQGVQTSAIVGTVLDVGGGVVQKATVIARGAHLIAGAQQVETDAIGRYRLVALPPGTYDVTAERSGLAIAKHSGVVVEVAATATVDFVLGAAPIAERVVVRQTAPMVDVQSASASTHIDRNFIETLPTARNVPAVINLSPGVAEDVGFGGTKESNAIYVDGVDITSPMTQKPWLHLNYNWLEQVEVAAPGAPVEYGESTGVIANVVLRAGGNRRDGLVDYWTTRPSWTDRNAGALPEALQTTFSPMGVISWWDTSAQMGGPLVKDRAWLFAGWASLEHETRPALYAGPASRVETDHSGLARLTLAAGRSARLEGFLQGGSYEVTGDGLGPFTTPEAAYAWRQPQTAWNVRMTWPVDATTLLEARSGGYASTEGFDPDRRDGPPSVYDSLTGIYSANTDYFADTIARQVTTVVTLSREVIGRVGRHHARFGFEREDAHTSDVDGFPGGGHVTAVGGVPTTALLWGGGSFTTWSTRTAVYAQDAWEIGPRITLSPGLRIDANRGSVPGVDEAFSTTPISPRVGVAWDVFASHRFVARAHVGRYADAVFHQRIGDLDGSDGTPFVNGVFAPDGQLVETGRSSPSDGSYQIDPDMQHSYVDQAFVGTEWLAGRDVTLSAQYMHRSFEKFMTTINRAWTWVPTTRQDPGPDGRLGTADDGPILDLFNREPANPVADNLYTNPDGAWRRYDGVQLVGRLRARWNSQMQASYTWSRSEGTVGNDAHTNAGLADLGLNNVFSDPNRLLNFVGNTRFDPSNEVKILASSRPPIWGGMTFSGVYQFRSGTTWERRATISLAHGSIRNLYMEPRGSRRLDPTSTLDLRVEKLLALRSLRSSRIGVYVEVFNVANRGVATRVQNNSGSTFGQPATWSDPRVWRIGFRWMF